MTSARHNRVDRRVFPVAQLSLILPGMNRWVGGLTMAVIGLLLVLAWNRHAIGAATAPLPAISAPSVPAAAPTASESPARPAPADSVRVEYELVQARTRTVAAPVPARVTLASQPRRAGVRSDSRRFVVRASRAIVGDGRYRPEPFPRPAAR